jgi:hypothetical protein
MQWVLHIALVAMLGYLTATSRRPYAQHRNSSHEEERNPKDRRHTERQDQGDAHCKRGGDAGDPRAGARARRRRIGWDVSHHQLFVSVQSVRRLQDTSDNKGLP